MDNHILQSFERWEACVTDPELREDLQHMRACLAEDESVVENAFFQVLEFGTAGLRGILGAGSNRMNIYTVGQATQGLAIYLNNHFENPSVAIAHDSRHKGVLFCEKIAEVLAANGIKAYLYPRLEPTPALSYATRALGCSAGINITASHNPAEYNGYKVYGSDGCQITSAAVKEIQAAIASVDMFTDVKTIPFEEALASGMASYIGEEVLDGFIGAVLEQRAGIEAPQDGSDLKLVYTPLNGTGLECVERILKCIGINDVTLVKEQAQPDGDFPTCTYPNPETKEALALGLEEVARQQADLLVATDPDADRAGIAVPHNGSYVLMTGNEVGILLTHWLAQRCIEQGGDIASKIVVTTIVSSSMIDILAQKQGFELRRTLTGFKYIGEQIGQLEAAGEPGRFLFGFEESYGYLAGTHVRDKDAIVATMLICEMARDYKARGMDLVEAIEQLYDTYGYYKNSTLSFAYPGAQGAQTMKTLMQGLRSNPPAEVAGLKVINVIDYATSAFMPTINGNDNAKQTLPCADVFELDLEGGNKLIIRPSGTEPKIKAYSFATAPSAEEAEALKHTLEDAARALLQ
ncbi:MAG: phospho-sugar mutase [Coriobacteriales bacterium]|nr:phospho-sugar mutase [Coriobacteriales bacterium]